MKRVYLNMAMVFFAGICGLKAQNSYTAIHFSDKRTYVVHDAKLEESEGKNALKKIADLNQEASASVLKNDELWIGSKKGIQVFDAKTQKRLRTEFADTPIAGLALDADGKIWVATSYKGLFRQNDQNGFDAKLNVSTNYCVVATPDRNVYAGTNLGLYQIPLADEGKTVRYAEEAHSGHGLPDNLVEHLHADASSNIWVVMPDNLSFKKSDNSFGEIPTFAFVGNKDNRIFKIVGLSYDNYLFVTSDGVLFVPSVSLNGHGHGDEVFSGQDSSAILLENGAISKPENAKDEPVLYAEKKGTDLYFYTKSALWKVREKQLFKYLKKKSTRKKSV